MDVSDVERNGKWWVLLTNEDLNELLQWTEGKKLKKVADQKSLQKNNDF